MPFVWPRRDVMITVLIGLAGIGLGYTTTSSLLDGDPHRAKIVEVEFFGAGPKSSRLVRSGWYPAESWGAWSEGPKAQVEWNLAGKPLGDIDVNIEGRIFPYYADVAQSIRVLVNERRIAVLQRNDEGELYGANFRIPNAVAIARVPLKFVFEIANPTAPSSVINSKDHRKIGLGLGTVKLTYDINTRNSATSGAGDVK